MAALAAYSNDPVRVRTSTTLALIDVFKKFTKTILEHRNNISGLDPVSLRFTQSVIHEPYKMRFRSYITTVYTPDASKTVQELITQSFAILLMLESLNSDRNGKYGFLCMFLTDSGYSVDVDSYAEAETEKYALLRISIIDQIKRFMGNLDPIEEGSDYELDRMLDYFNFERLKANIISRRAAALERYTHATAEQQGMLEPCYRMLRRIRVGKRKNIPRGVNVLDRCAGLTIKLEQKLAASEGPPLVTSGGLLRF